MVWKNKDHVSTRFGDYVDECGNVVKPNVDSRKDIQAARQSHFDGARMPFAMFFRGGYAMHQGYVPPYALRTVASACRTKWPSASLTPRRSERP